jgi:hypothetical protein
MPHSSWNDHFLLSIQNFSGLRHAPTDPGNSQYQTFRILSLIFPGDQILQLSDLVKLAPQEVISEWVEQHQR